MARASYTRAAEIATGLSRRRAALVECVDRVETELRRLGYWEAVPPAPERLASETPFCVDTLTLPEWLQWRFIPQLLELIDNDAALPEECAIHPYAEHCLAEEPRDVSELLTLISRIDTLITEPESATPH